MTDESDPPAGRAVTKRATSQPPARKSAVKKPAAKEKAAAWKRPVVHYTELTMYQRNTLYRLIEKAGLIPAEFTWRRERLDRFDGKDDSLPTLIHNGSEGSRWFAVGIDSTGRMTVRYTPGKESHWQWQVDSYWHSVQSAFADDWLAAVREQIRHGDLWKKLEE